MECLPVSKLPQGSQWVWEIKLDGYRALAVKQEGKLNLFSKNRKSFNGRFRYIVEAPGDMPDNTVVDGEIVALEGNRLTHNPASNRLLSNKSLLGQPHSLSCGLLV